MPFFKKSQKSSTSREDQPARASDSLTTEEDNSDDGRDHDFDCGWWKYKPKWIQKFNNRGCAFFTLVCVAFFQGSIINGVFYLIVPTIERRFNLRSVDSGLISGAFNTASLICLVPVTYFGGRLDSSKPRWIGVGLIVMGVGSLTFSLPYFITENHTGRTQKDLLSSHQLCSDTYFLPTSNCGNKNETIMSSYKWILITGHFLHGMGSSPLFTLGVAFIDESCTKKESGVYLGLYYVGATIGIAFGYVVGGLFLQIPENLVFTPENKIQLSSPNSNGVGAWWLAFSLYGVIFMILSIPVLAIPARLPGWENRGNVKEMEAVTSRERTQSYYKTREIPTALLELCKNRSFIFLNFAGCCEGLIISGSSTFIPKLIQLQFNLSSKTTSMVMGVITIPSAVLGMMVGGIILKKFNLRFVGVLKLCIATTTMSMICVSCFFITCSQREIVGVDLPYFKNQTKITLKDQCNTHCGCLMGDFVPICDAFHNVSYFSPCLAGCHKSYTSNRPDVILYSNCSCIQESEDWDLEASSGTCQVNCPLLPLFLLLVYLCLFFTFVNAMPALTATLRCVETDMRPLALGVQWVLVRLLGMIPGPILFGAVIDMSCQHWNVPKCSNDNGSCALYDHQQIGWTVVLFAYWWKSLEILLFVLSMYFYKKDTLNQRASAY